MILYYYCTVLYSTVQVVRCFKVPKLVPCASYSSYGEQAVCGRTDRECYLFTYTYTYDKDSDKEKKKKKL